MNTKTNRVWSLTFDSHLVTRSSLPINNGLLSYTGSESVRPLSDSFVLYVIPG